MSLRAPDALALGEASVAPAIIAVPLCARCGENPRAGCGALSRCIPCIREAAERDRQDRIAAEALVAERLRQTVKVCRTCKREKSVADFSPHRLAKDGRRKNCRACVSANRVKRKALTPEQKARDRELRQQPHRKAANLEAVISWQARNPAAIRAARLLDADVRHAKITPATTCEAERCEATGRLHGHHNSYSRRRVAWLCAGCHRLCHSGVPLRLKESAALRVARAPKTA